jgi:hypothetical protein
MPQLFYEEGSTRTFLLFLIEERRVFEREPFENFAHEKGKLLSFSGIGAVVASVDEGVLFHGVPMKVAKQ